MQTLRWFVKHTSSLFIRRRRLRIAIDDLSCQMVSMMQTTQPRHRDNLLAGVQTYRFPASRSLFVQAEMGSVVVMITDVVGHQASQMPLVEHDHVVEQIAATTAHEPFRYTVLPRAFERRADRFGVDGIFETTG